MRRGKEIRGKEGRYRGIMERDTGEEGGTYGGGRRKIWEGEGGREIHRGKRGEMHTEGNRKKRRREVSLKNWLRT